MENFEFTNQGATNDIDILGEINKYLKYWYLFVISILVFFIVAKVYLRYTTPIYESYTEIKILDNSSSSFKLPDNMISIFGGKNTKRGMDNEIEMIKSYQLMERVVKNLDLTTHYYAIGYFTTKELWKNQPFSIKWLKTPKQLESKSLRFNIEIVNGGYEIVNENENEGTGVIPFNSIHIISGIPFKISSRFGSKYSKYIGKQYVFELSPLRQTAMSLSSGIGIKSVANQSDILGLSLTGSNTAKIEAILNEVVKQFDLDGIKDRQLVSQRTIDFVNNRFNFLGRQLDSIEDDKERYKRDNGLTNVDTDIASAAKNMEAAKASITEIENQIELTNYFEKALKTHNKFESFPLEIGISNGLMNQLFGNYNSLVFEREKLLFSAGENNPKIKIINEQLDILKKDMFKALKNYQQELQASLVKFNTGYKEYAEKFNKLPLYEKFIRSIERQQGIKEALYILLLQKREEAAINVAVTGPSIKVVDFASSNTNAISPKKDLIFGGSLLIGLLVPFLFVFIKNFLDNKIHNKQELLKIVKDIPIVSEIPFIGDDLKIMLDNDRSVLAESFRILRTNIGYLLPIKEDKVAPILFVTSTIKGEGKTFTSINLGMAFATLSKKVLVIGADLRNPQFHNYTNLDKSHVGLSNYLYDTSVDWRNLTIKNQFDSEYLDLIFSGIIPPNPAELLSNGRLESLLNEARKEYDYIVVDTAPTLLVTDTLTISQFADVTLFVVRADYTEKKIIQYSLELKQKEKLKNLAFVLNNVGVNIGYSYKYGYGYGYGYGEDVIKKSWFKEFLNKKFNI